MQYYSLKDYGIAGKTKDAPDTTPVNVVASAYDTSGTGGRKIVRLANGWIVAASYSSPKIYFHVSKDNGATWAQLCTTSLGTQLAYYAIASNGTTVYAILPGVSSAVAFVKFDAATVTNVDLPFTGFDSGQTALSGISLCIDGTGTLHAAWASKNSTYPNSFNIRYSKSTDGGVTWATPTQLTNDNSSSLNCSNPCIVVRSNNNPVILFGYSTGGYGIKVVTYNGTAWSGVTAASAVNVYWGDSYTQSNPCAAVDSNGVIHVVWMGMDATDSAVYNIRYSKSTDGGVTWAAATKLTSGNANTQAQPSLVIDQSNKIYILFVGKDAAVANVSNIRRIIHDGTAWGGVTTLTANTTADAFVVSSLWSKFNMNSDDAVRWIYVDQQNAGVKYSSKPFTKVPDTTPSIIETYIPLWMADGASVSATPAQLGYLKDGSGSLSASAISLFTLSSSWPADKRYAFQATVWNSSGLVNGDSIVSFYDPVAGRWIGQIRFKAETTATTFRTATFTLTPGTSYGVQLYASNSENVTLYITDASLVVFG